MEGFLVPKMMQKSIFLPSSVFGRSFSGKSQDFLSFLDFSKSRPCYFEQTLHAIARFLGYRLFRSRTLCREHFAPNLTERPPIFVTFLDVEGQKNGLQKTTQKITQCLIMLGPFWAPKWTLEASFLRVVFSCVRWTVFGLILGATVHPGEGNHSYPFCIFFVPGHPWGPKWLQGCPKDPQASILLPF